MDSKLSFSFHSLTLVLKLHQCYWL